LHGVWLWALYPLLAVILIQLLKLLFGTDAGSAQFSMLSVFVMVGFMAGGAVGCFTGIILGLIVGGVLAMVTYRILLPTKDVRRYRYTMEVICIVVGGPAALLLVLASGLPQFGANGWGAEWSWLVWGVVPTLIASIGIWWAGHHVADWAGATATATA